MSLVKEPLTLNVERKDVMLRLQRYASDDDVQSPPKQEDLRDKGKRGRSLSISQEVERRASSAESTGVAVKNGTRRVSLVEQMQEVDRAARAATRVTDLEASIDALVAADDECEGEDCSINAYIRAPSSACGSAHSKKKGFKAMGRKASGNKSASASPSSSSVDHSSFKWRSFDNPGAGQQVNSRTFSRGKSFDLGSSSRPSPMMRGKSIDNCDSAPVPPPLLRRQVSNPTGMATAGCVTASPRAGPRSSSNASTPLMDNSPSNIAKRLTPKLRPSPLLSASKGGIPPFGSSPSLAPVAGRHRSTSVERLKSEASTDSPRCASSPRLMALERLIRSAPLNPAVSMTGPSPISGSPRMSACQVPSMPVQGSNESCTPASSSVSGDLSRAKATPIFGSMQAKNWKPDPGAKNVEQVGEGGDGDDEPMLFIGRGRLQSEDVSC
jgi:hypothetical protein